MEQAVMTKKQPLAEFFHVRHACGHSVYWSSADYAIRTAPFSCPWCGGEASIEVSPDEIAIQMSDALVFREFLSGQRVPVPEGWPRADEIVIRHLPDESCCGGNRKAH
jgi:hypothetical protein